MKKIALTLSITLLTITTLHSNATKNREDIEDLKTIARNQEKLIRQLNEKVERQQEALDILTAIFASAQPRELAAQSEEDQDKPWYTRAATGTKNWFTNRIWPLMVQQIEYNIATKCNQVAFGTINNIAQPTLGFRPGLYIGFDLPQTAPPQESSDFIIAANNVTVQQTSSNGETNK